MEWKVRTYDELTKEELYDMLQMRAEIFVVEQDCVYQDLDYNDQRCTFLMGYDQGKLIASMRVVPLGVESESEGSIGRIVVDKEYRGQGLGHELVNRGIELYNQVVGQKFPIVIHAQSQLEKFYSQHGFVAKTEPFMFEGLPHTIMELIQQDNSSVDSQ